MQKNVQIHRVVLVLTFYVGYEKAYLRKLVFKIELDILILPTYYCRTGGTGDFRGMALLASRVFGPDKSKTFLLIEFDFLPLPTCPPYFFFYFPPCLCREH